MSIYIQRIATLCLILVIISCYRTQHENTSFGSDAKAGLVIVFKENADDTAINKFLERELLDGSVKTQFGLKPGISSLTKVNVQGHTAYAIQFFPHATREEKEAIKKSTVNSSFVAKVFQDVAPIDIKER